MAIETVRNVLISASAVTSLVPSARIEPIRRTQATAIPAITLQRPSVVPENHLTGWAGLDGSLVQLDVFASTYAEARSIADACRTALQDAGHLMTLEVDGFEPDVDPELYRLILTFQVWTQ